MTQTTLTNSVTTLKTKVEDLNALIYSGQLLEAFVSARL